MNVHTHSHIHTHTIFLCTSVVIFCPHAFLHMKNASVTLSLLKSTLKGNPKFGVRKIEFFIAFIRF